LIQRTQAEFTPMTGIEVTWDDTPYSSFQEKLQTEASSGSDQYDIIMWVDSWGHGLKPFLAPLNDRIAEAGIDMQDFPDAYVQAATGEDGETIYGLPLRGHAQVLFYRTDILEQAGVEPPTTWQDLVEIAPAIKETGHDPIAIYYGVNGGQNLFIWLNMLWGNGSDVFDAEYRPTFNNEAGVEATQLYVDLLKNGFTAPGSVTFNEQDANLEMLQGRAAMFVGWWWMYSNFKNPETTAPEVADNIGFLPAPGWEGGEPISYGYIWPTGILQASQNQDAAWEYLKWMTNAATEKQVALDKTNPALDNIVVVHKSNMTDPEINETTGGLQEAGGKILETARTQPLIAEWPEVQTVLEIAINEMANGAPVQARLDQAAQEVEQIMERSGRY
jgi:multiple sugar transport system substrate-binding protein